MADTYVECLVSRKTPGYAFVVKALFAALIVSTFFIAMTMSFLFFIVTVALVIAAIYVFPRFSVEYEYIFLGDELDVDKILNKSSRKTVGKYPMSRVELVAMKNSSEMRPFTQNPSNKNSIVDYTTGNGDEGVYGIVYSDENGKRIILFEPSDKLLNAMKYNSPRKVILDC